MTHSTEQLFYTQESGFSFAKENNHTFLFSIDNPVPNKTGEHTKCYSSSNDIHSFIDYYMTIPDSKKHFYETVYEGTNFYEFYDLDVHIPENIQNNYMYTNMKLFTWFTTIHTEFTQSMNMRKPNWIITTASDHTKLSLHLVNRNACFKDNQTFKQYYASFKSYVHSFVQKEHEFFKAIDWLMSSKNRNLRLIGSTKFKGTRRLVYWKEHHTEDIPLHYSFVTDANNDSDIDNKCITHEICSKLFSPPILPKEPRPLKEGEKKEVKSFNTSEKYVINNIQTDSSYISELLSLLSNERADDYEDWLKVSFALKHSHCDVEYFKQFSKRSPKYNEEKCLEHWISLQEKVDGNPVTLGTVHYFAQQDNEILYNNFMRKWVKPNINIPFTPDMSIHSRYIPQEFYATNLKLYNTIAIKSNMNTGKTFPLPTIFKDYTKIVVIYFRVSLNVELHKKWKEHGFEYYKDIQGQISTDKHPKIIIQLDSIGRLVGNTDLFILDEVESTLSHMCSSQHIKNKQNVFSPLYQYIKHSPKLILADANLCDDTLKCFKLDTKHTLKVENTYKSLSHIKCTVVHEENGFIHHIKSLLEDGKRLVIPTNKKKFCKQIEKYINKHCPNVKVLSIYPEKKQKDVEINTDDWLNYDVVIYTPTICAGISFEHIHFHACIAYFVNRSCNAEMSSQMLLRVRNLIDNSMYIYTQHDSGLPCLPITDDDIDAHLNEYIRVGHQHLVEHGLSIDNYHVKVKKNKYYSVYKGFLRKKHLSELYFNSYLKTILTNHGVTVSEKNYMYANEDELESIQADICKINNTLKEEQVDDIIRAPVIKDIEQYKALRNSQKEKTPTEQLSMKRFYITNTFDLPPDYEFVENKFNTFVEHPPESNNIQRTTQWVKRNLPFIQGYSFYKQFHTLPTLDECILKCTENHEISYNSNLEREYLNTCSDSEEEKEEYSDDSENEWLFHLEREKKQMIKKKNVGKTVVSSIHYNTNWLKLKYCFQFLKIVGFQSLKDESKIKPKWEDLLTFCRENELTIQSLFSVKQKKWKNMLDPTEKISLSKYICDKLKKMLGITLCPTNKKKESEYKLKKEFLV